jgi:hypothetical protein
VDFVSSPGEGFTGLVGDDLPSPGFRVPGDQAPYGEDMQAQHSLPDALISMLGMGSAQLVQVQLAVQVA